LPLRANVEGVLTRLLEAEKGNTCGAESGRTYFDMHKARFADILQV
jgi:hypothetical protein